MGVTGDEIVPKQAAMPEQAPVPEQVAVPMQRAARKRKASVRRIDWGPLRQAALQKLLNRHSGLVERFLSIAERVVYALDEYGDENWKGLDREILRCIQKIAERERGLLDNSDSKGEFRGCRLRLRSLDDALWDFDRSMVYTAVFQALDKEFRRFHAKQDRSKVSPEEVAKMTGVEFENYLMRLLQQQGCSVGGTSATGDQGADIIARIADRVIVIQAKRSGSVVGNRAVQEVVAALAYYRGTEAWVVTNSTFTKAGQELAQLNGVRLISGSDLARLGDLLAGGRHP